MEGKWRFKLRQMIKQKEEKIVEETYKASIKLKISFVFILSRWVKTEEGGEKCNKRGNGNFRKFSYIVPKGVIKNAVIIQNYKKRSLHSYFICNLLDTAFYINIFLDVNYINISVVYIQFRLFSNIYSYILLHYSLYFTHIRRIRSLNSA
jgi:hypothetical protein